MDTESSMDRVLYDTRELTSMNIVEYVEPDHNGLSWKQMALESPREHPWRDLLVPRSESLSSVHNQLPDTDPPPKQYREVYELRQPRHNQGYRQIRETVRLSDVERFREGTLQHLGKSPIRLPFPEPDPRPVVYRYTDLLNNDLSVFEAIHFEIFAPDRDDLRFIAIPSDRVVSKALQGDCVTVASVDLLASPSFSIRLGKSLYPVVWTCPKGALWKVRYTNTPPDRSELGCIDLTVTYAVSEYPDEQARIGGPRSRESPVLPLRIRGHLWQSPDPAACHTIVRMDTRLTSSSHLYPVEPIRNQDKYMDKIRRISMSSRRPGRVVTSARALDEAEQDRVNDRLDTFDGYGQEGDTEWMNSHFRLGCRFRDLHQPKADPRDPHEPKFGDSSVVRSLMSTLPVPRALLDCLYSKIGDREELWLDGQLHTEIRRINQSTRYLSLDQARALDLCSSPPRFACIQSAPGSGKTTLAAAAATAVGSCSQQPVLLLAMQNVAVDQIGTVLKGLIHEKRVVNLKATEKLNPFCVAAYDFFDYQTAAEVERWRQRKREVDKALNDNIPGAKAMHRDYWKRLDVARRSHEEHAEPAIILSTVELVLNKMMSYGGAIKRALDRVRSIIIDEASLLTEAALFCICRCFPRASIILIGDKEQLSPYQYTPGVLGQELAARSGLELAMKSRRIPTLTITEVFRAPQSLVEPYNRIAYGRQLVSRIPEHHSPLTRRNLVDPGRPQLLFVEVRGFQEIDERSDSLYNVREGETLLRLLDRFPSGYADRIMVICMYGEQARRVRYFFEKNREYDQIAVHTVNSSQGKEKPIVIVLTTRTVRSGNRDFFDCRKRCNVAASRQQQALIIVGDPDVLTMDRSPWRTLVCGDDFTRKSSEEI